MSTDVYIKGVCPCAFPENMFSIYYPLCKNLYDGFDLVTEVRFSLAWVLLSLCLCLNHGQLEADFSTPIAAF